jgi:hypothetical protein
LPGRPFGGHQAEHFADYSRADGEHPPLFELDEGLEPFFVESQVHAAIRAPAKGVFDMVALSAIRLGNEVFKVFPRRFPELVEAGLLVNEAVVFPRKQEGSGGEASE